VHQLRGGILDLGARNGSTYGGHDGYPGERQTGGEREDERERGGEMKGETEGETDRGRDRQRERQTEGERQKDR
jgi:hypothetical protein